MIVFRLPNVLRNSLPRKPTTGQSRHRITRAGAPGLGKRSLPLSCMSRRLYGNRCQEASEPLEAAAPDGRRSESTSGASVDRGQAPAESRSCPGDANQGAWYQAAGPEWESEPHRVREASEPDLWDRSFEEDRSAHRRTD